MPGQWKAIEAMVERLIFSLERCQCDVGSDRRVEHGGNFVIGELVESESEIVEFQCAEWKSCRVVEESEVAFRNSIAIETSRHHERSVQSDERIGNRTSKENDDRRETECRCLGVEVLQQ